MKWKPVKGSYSWSDALEQQHFIYYRFQITFGEKRLDFWQPPQLEGSGLNLGSIFTPTLVIMDFSHGAREERPTQAVLLVTLGLNKLTFFFFSLKFRKFSDIHPLTFIITATFKVKCGLILRLSFWATSLFFFFKKKTTKNIKTLITAKARFCCLFKV